MAAAVRERTSSLRKTLPTCRVTVAGLMYSKSAIWRSECPAPTSASTCCSRGVSLASRTAAESVLAAVSSRAPETSFSASWATISSRVAAPPAPQAAVKTSGGSARRAAAISC